MDWASARGRDGGACRLDSRWTEPRHPWQGLWGLDARVQLRETSITVGQGKVQQVELVFAHKRFSRKRELGRRRRVIFGGRGPAASHEPSQLDLFKPNDAWARCRAHFTTAQPTNQHPVASSLGRQFMGRGSPMLAALRTEYPGRGLSPLAVLQR